MYLRGSVGGGGRGGRQAGSQRCAPDVRIPTRAMPARARERSFPPPRPREMRANHASDATHSRGERRAARAHPLPVLPDHREELDLGLEHVLDALQHIERRLTHGCRRCRPRTTRRRASAPGARSAPRVPASEDDRECAALTNTFPSWQVCQKNCMPEFVLRHDDDSRFRISSPSPSSTSPRACECILSVPKACSRRPRRCGTTSSGR